MPDAADTTLPARLPRRTTSLALSTLADRVHLLVRDRILAGEFAGGAPIRQDAIAGELGISKIPLREALARLEQEGLVVSHPNRGYAVAPLSAAEAEEVFALRLTLEPEATVAGSGRATDAEREAANATLAVLDGLPPGSWDQAVANRDFHLALIRPGAGRLTLSVLERLAMVADRYVVLHLRPSGRDARARGEHRAILDAWIARDAARLDRLCRDHLGNTLADLREQLGVRPPA